MQHSYPHCWRHKTPVIFRATPQWFISMEKNGLRKNALRDIPKVKWIPAWGQQRIAGMIETRPDWCISRQRTWGVPIALFIPQRGPARCIPRTAGADRAGRCTGGERRHRRVVRSGCARAARDDADQYRKVTDVMDVWADSGVSFECVGKERPEIAAPVEMYLEGSDQHRGWFHSSLLMSEALYERAPYKSVLTYGFTVDEKGRKMSQVAGQCGRTRQGDEHAGRRCAAPVGGSHRLHQRDELLGRDPQAHVRFIPAHAQHGALPARQPAWLRSCRAWPCPWSS